MIIYPQSHETSVDMSGVQWEDYVIADLDAETWTDFERFFAKYNGVQACCWCVYYHRTGATPGKTMEEKCRNNLDMKKAMVHDGRSRGVLIYSHYEVIASCQYGPGKDFPRIDRMRRYSAIDRPLPANSLWRITCFFVDRAHRRRGVTRLALDAVLERISQNGGGLVEAYPVKNRKGVENWFGPLKIFSERGFEIVGNFGNSNVLVRKTVRAESVE